MKITNVSALRISLADLRLAPEAQTVGQRGEDHYLQPGASIYLPDTGEVLRSVTKGDIRKWINNGTITINDVLTLANNTGATLTHGLGYPPSVLVLKQVGSTWVDATGTYDMVHNLGFTALTITNVSGVQLTLTVRVG